MCLTLSMEHGWGILHWATSPKSSVPIVFVLLRVSSSLWHWYSACRLLLCNINGCSMVGNSPHFHRFNDLLTYPFQIHQIQIWSKAITFRIIYEYAQFRCMSNIDDFMTSICTNCGFLLGEFIPGMPCPHCDEPML